MSPDIIKQRLINHLILIYPEENLDELADRIIEAFWPNTGGTQSEENHFPGEASWSEATTFLITYGDSILNGDEKPLQTLHNFLNENLQDTISGVHILPFFPYSSDAGFAVMDYMEVHEDLGDWDDIKAIGKDFKLMADLVINHASSRGTWFQGFLAGEEKYKNFFMTADPEDDLSEVVRPRPSPLLTGYDTQDGLQYVWCTFGPDQVDLNFANPDVLVEFVKIMRFYLGKNVRTLRLDAVAFLWKEVGTNCIHMPQTHEVVRLLRTLADFFRDDVLIITETNVPNHENLTYFGDQNEAHLIYNFALPPLLIQALLTGNEYYLKKWLMGMPPTQEGCAYLNFVASHDGVGLRPATGILLEEDFEEMVRTVRAFGGEISMRTAEGGTQKPYEMNISLFDALKGTIKGEDEYQRQRFLASQAIMMSLEGVPAFYIHTLLATPNDYEKFRRSGHNRCINRKRWRFHELEKLLNNPESDQRIVFDELRRMIKIRIAQKCFHPNATQFTLHLPEGFFGFWRQSLDRRQNTFCVTNLTDAPLTLSMQDINLYPGADWTDLLTGTRYSDLDEDIIFEPYQSVWITNHPAEEEETEE